MSARVSGAVWGESRDGERLGGSRHGGSTLLVLLALADFSHDDGGSIYPSISTLAQKTRLSERQVQRTIAILEKSSEVFVHRGAGPGGVNLYTINLKVLGMGGDKMTPPVTDATAGGDAHVTTGVTHLAPDPLSEPSLNLKSARTREDSSLRKAKKRTIPDDFILTPDRRGKIIAAGNRKDCPDLDPEAFFAHFAEKCRDEGYTYSNWDRALVEWCRREGPKSPYRAAAPFADSRPQREVKDVIAASFGMTRAEYDEFTKRDRAGQISKEDRSLLLDGKISIFALESQIAEERI
jgi:Helix-turn-helix domain